jgi:hypothetical protein
LRACVREEQSLRTLGTVIGATRAFTPDEAEVIRLAFAARRAKRAGKPKTETCANAVC